MDEFTAKYPSPDIKRTSLIVWMNRLLETFVKRGTLAHKPGAGRKRRLPLMVAIQCANVLMNGYTTADGQRMWYTSINEACTINPILSKALTDYNIKPNTLLKACKRACPKLSRRALTVKPPLQNKRHNVQEKRLSTALHLNSLPRHMFMRTFWLDGASVCVRPDGSIMVWASSDEQNLLRTDPHLALQNKKCVWLKYYACVNALEGPVGLVFVSGTTGLPLLYKVSTCRQSFAEALH